MMQLCADNKYGNVYYEAVYSPINIYFFSSEKQPSKLKGSQIDRSFMTLFMNLLQEIFFRGK